MKGCKDGKSGKRGKSGRRGAGGRKPLPISNAEIDAMMEELPRLLRGHRKREKVSQERFSKRAGCARSTVSHAETNACEPGLRQFLQFSRNFPKRPDQLLFRLQKRAQRRLRLTRRRKMSGH